MGKGMNMTNREAVIRFNELKSISKNTGVLGWYIYKNLKALEEATEPYRKVHDNIIRKYGGTEVDPVPEGKMNDVMAEMNEILDMEIDVDLVLMKRMQFEQIVQTAKDMTAETMLIIDRNLVEP